MVFGRSTGAAPVIAVTFGLYMPKSARDQGSQAGAGFGFGITCPSSQKTMITKVRARMHARYLIDRPI
jgi:hypothetical protein